MQAGIRDDLEANTHSYCATTLWAGLVSGVIRCLPFPEHEKVATPSSALFASVLAQTRVQHSALSALTVTLTFCIGGGAIQSNGRLGKIIAHGSSFRVFYQNFS
jgi:hypothetical protein